MEDDSNLDDQSDLNKLHCELDDDIEHEDLDQERAEEDGVWSADIEQSFQEALAIYPPCGRRKIILSDEGKMYGRNELIARYIKLRTGKTRTRKQVSSHIQVLARRRHKDNCDPTQDTPSSSAAIGMADSAMTATMETYAPSQPLATATELADSIELAWTGAARNPLSVAMDMNSGGNIWSTSHQGALNSNPASLFRSPPLRHLPLDSHLRPDFGPLSVRGFGLAQVSAWQCSDMDMGHCLASVGPLCFRDSQQQQHLQGGRAMIENVEPTFAETLPASQIWDRFPPHEGGLQHLMTRSSSRGVDCFFLLRIWLDISPNFQENDDFKIKMSFNSAAPNAISISTSVCSFSKAIVDTKLTLNESENVGPSYLFIEEKKMCNYLRKFLLRLKQCKDKSTMNSVLENFGIMQTIRDKATDDLLLCLVYMFAVAEKDILVGGHSQFRLYHLTNPEMSQPC